MPKSSLTLKDYLYELKLFQSRVIVVSLLIILCCIGLAVRLIFLQIYQHKLYTTLSEHNQITLLPLPPKRGLIFDRNGVLLAKNIPVFSLEVIPEYTHNLRSTITQLKKLVTLDEDDISEFYKLLKQTKHFQSIPIKIQLTPEEVAKFAVNQYQFPGVMIKARLIRDYPLGAALSQVVGYVGRINAQEYSQIDQSNYSIDGYIGKVGIEKYYEAQLHGKAGYEKVEIDASGRIIRVLQKQPAIAGDNLYLTIDSELEQVAEKALGDNAGAVVAIQPNTGEILALVSNPSYDPNQFVAGLSNKTFLALQDAPDRPLYNRALRGQYPIASTIKPFLGLAGLNNGVITPEYTIRDPGYFILNGTNHVYHDWLHRGHGYVNLTKAITESCDTYFYNLANLLGINAIDEVLHEFGFGSTTGIDMNEELPGLVASPAWKKQRMQQHWYSGDTVNASIGQGYMLTTPLQLANATAALATRGQHFQPHLLYKLALPNQDTVTISSIELTPIVFQPATWQVVLSAMHDVIYAGDGTGYRFGRNAPYDAAGKTGTAQVYSLKQDQHSNDQTTPKSLRDHSLFIAFAPFNNPQIALAVVVEHSKEAASVARKVLDYYLLQEKKAS